MHAELPGTDETHAMGRRIQRGTVKWFNDAKGYGFVQADDGTDAFVHYSSISSEGFRTLSVGQPVSYEELRGPKGLVAVNVVPTVQER
jgi:CspA family cold shock protein